MTDTVPAETPEEKWQRLANLVADKYNADVVLYSGEIEDGVADQLIKLAKQTVRKENIVLMLTTRGGSPDAAYRMARCLQRQYKKIVLYIYGICKSAGTLVAVGAHEIILSDFGEFGPLDIQLGKQDELFETVSGLNITQALNSLNTRAQDVFRSTLIDLKGGSRGQISTKLAAEIASNFAIGLHEKIYAQIDPVQLGSIERSINIASDYGSRLKTDNVKENTVDKLVSGYPSHSFVIDIKEAETLFNVVRMPDANEEELGECISWVTRDPAKNTFVQKINTVIMKEPANEESCSKTSNDKGTNRAQSRSSQDNSVGSESDIETPSRPRAIK
jgi:hypothetical protein